MYIYVFCFLNTDGYFSQEYAEAQAKKLENQQAEAKWCKTEMYETLKYTYS